MSTPALSEVALSDYAKEYDPVVPERTVPRVLEFDLATDPEYNRHLDRVVWWKMDLCILPAATLIFFLSFLVRLVIFILCVINFLTWRYVITINSGHLVLKSAGQIKY